MQMINKSGRRTETWCITALTVLQKNITIRNYFLFSVFQKIIRGFNNLPEPQLNISLCHTLSKALDMAKKTLLTSYFLSCLMIIVWLVKTLFNCSTGITGLKTKMIFWYEVVLDHISTKRFAWIKFMDYVSNIVHREMNMREWFFSNRLGKRKYYNSIINQQTMIHKKQITTLLLQIYNFKNVVKYKELFYLFTKCSVDFSKDFGFCACVTKFCEIFL